MQPDSTSLAFDHIGIICDDPELGAAKLASQIGADGLTRRFDDPQLGVSVVFLRDVAGTVYELIAPLGEKSPVARTLKSGKDVLNQVAYLTKSIAETGAQLRAGGAMVLGQPEPAVAFGGAMVQFFYSPLGFIIEIIEAVDHQHDFMPVSQAITKTNSPDG